jgi:cystathionine gamma-synthase
MSAFGGMLSFRAKDGREAALRAVSRARLFTRATSLGGVESLVEHRATSEGPGGTAPADLVRLSIGLEHPDDLVADLLQALS